MAFDLALFRGLAFGRRAGPDHPIADEQEARRMIETLPRNDPAAALAEITYWAVSINENATFSPEQRARVMMEMDVAAHQFWRPLGAEFFAAGGKPLEGRDGDLALLQAVQESAAQFSNAFELCLTPEALQSRWVRANLGSLVLRRARWQTRKMILSRMLRLPGAEERWSELHRLYKFAVEHGVEKAAAPVFPGNPRASSVKQEYVRMLLIDITRPDRMLARDVEFAYRMIGRVTANVRLEPEPLPSALHAVVPEGSQRPMSLARFNGVPPPGALYIDATNALPRLKALAERNLDLDPSEPDPLFGSVFTVRERRALIATLTEQWTAAARQRGAKRIALKANASVYNGFAGACRMLPALDQGSALDASAAKSTLRIQLDDAEQKRQAAARAAHIARELRGHVNDASASGIGLTLSRREAGWAKLGSLLAVCIEPGPDWVLGVVRRMNAEEEELRLGVAVICRKPRVAWFHAESTGHTTVWDDEKRFERNFDEYFQRGILVDGATPAASGQILLPAGLAARGSRIDIPMATGVHRLVVSGVIEETQDFQRVAYDPQAVSPYARRGG